MEEQIYFAGYIKNCTSKHEKPNTRFSPLPATPLGSTASWTAVYRKDVVFSNLVLTATEIACSTALLLFSLFFFSFPFFLFYSGGCDYLYILYGFKLTVLLLQSLDIRIIGRCHHSCYQLVLSFKFRAFIVLGDSGESIVTFRVIVSESKLRFQISLTLYVNIALAVVQKPSPPFRVCQSCLKAPQQIH